MSPVPVEGTASERRLGGGCGIVLALLVAFLVGGFLVLDRGVGWLVDRARQRVSDGLPAELDGELRARLELRLERFVDTLPEAGDRNRLTGEFLGLVGTVLEDRLVTVAEATTLDGWLAEALGEPLHPPRAEQPR